MIFTKKDLSLFNIFTPILRKKTFPDFGDYYQHKRETLRQVLPDFLAQNSSNYQLLSPKILLEIPTQNPTNLTNPYWQWLVQNNISAYDLLHTLKLEIPQPFWGMGRIGQNSTLLPDGREILIGGEFEDGYDPMFHIYNDVIVKHPSGEIEIFGYPNHVFPPTDFHTATLLGDKIYIIGSMGYFDQRHYGETPIFQLDTNTLQIHRIESRNHIGWINDHQAIAKDGQILVSGGRIFDSENSSIRETIDTWAFNPKTLIWKNVTNRQWQGFWITRKDSLDLSVAQYDWLIYCLEYPNKFDNQEKIQEFKETTGLAPDIALYSQLFRPPVPHDVEEQTIKNTFVIYVDEIKVRYVTDSNYIQVYIEGVLPPYKLELLQENLRHKLSKLENFACEVKDLVF